MFRGRLSLLMITTSPCWRLRLGRIHFCCSWRVWRNSLFQRTQNSLAKCWTRFHLFRRYRSARWNSPGLSCKQMIADVKFSTVRERLLTTASTCVMKVWRDSSFSWLPHWSSRTESTLRAVRICRSQMPPIWLADGTFSWNSIQSQLGCKRKWRTRVWSIDDSAFCSSFLAPTRLLSWSHLIVCTGPRQLMNRRKAFMNESVSRVADTSRWIARLDKHVNNTP